MRTYGKQIATDMSRTATSLVRKTGAGDILKLFIKWFLIIAFAFFILKWLIKKVIEVFKGPSDGTGHNSLWTQLTGNYVVNPNAAGGSYVPPSAGQVDPLVKIRALVDQIENLLGGTTFLYYPDVVNRLANLSEYDLRRAAYYWDQKYKSGHGGGLYSFLVSEDWSGYYKAAIGALYKANIRW